MFQSSSLSSGKGGPSPVPSGGVNAIGVSHESVNTVRYIQFLSQNTFLYDAFFASLPEYTTFRVIKRVGLSAKPLT